MSKNNRARPISKFAVAFFVILMNFTAIQSDAHTKTSITDQQSYREFALLAATDSATFSNFKRSKVFFDVMQHVNHTQGMEFLNLIKDDYPHLLEYMDQFKENDSVGNPVTYKFEEFGQLSPTNLRYIKIAGDIEKLTGDLTNSKIVEIGGGYGGQCKILSDLFDYEKYTLIDLPEPLELAKRHSRVLGVPKLRFLYNTHVNGDEEYDLVISNYAFSECTREVQEEYLTKILFKSKSGYLICNDLSDLYAQKSYSRRELEELLEDQGFSVRLLPEVPLTSPKNYVLFFSRDTESPYKETLSE